MQFSLLCAVRLLHILNKLVIKVMLYKKRPPFRDETVNISFSVFYMDYLAIHCLHLQNITGSKLIFIQLWSCC